MTNSCFNLKNLKKNAHDQYVFRIQIAPSPRFGMTSPVFCPTYSPFPSSEPAEITNHAAAAMMRTYWMKHIRSHRVINKKTQKIQTIIQNKNVVKAVVSKNCFYTCSSKFFKMSQKKKR